MDSYIGPGYVGPILAFFSWSGFVLALFAWSDSQLLQLITPNARRAVDDAERRSVGDSVRALQLLHEFG